MKKIFERKHSLDSYQNPRTENLMNYDSRFQQNNIINQNRDEMIHQILENQHRAQQNQQRNQFLQSNYIGNEPKIIPKTNINKNTDSSLFLKLIQNNPNSVAQLLNNYPNTKTQTQI
ncbi:hypothetical protein M0811_04927 [Anaeramoeba ignava]|uniref:Uncharacterized protein n=1 Tax=Anaeramoeba ignava TaxID=1746090 RepID=A0A9Q0LT92_ANAIG|nr:hypothetical protein M0811_04927 [Anaeramoeba ignava]